MSDGEDHPKKEYKQLDLEPKTLQRRHTIAGIQAFG
jgi:hypothetical protein